MGILIVDDDPIILDLLPAILRREGHTDIRVAASGSAAIDILMCPENRFDILIFDIAMPEMDGIALCREVRKMPAYCTTPIIMLTAKSDKLSVEGAFVAGANDYITKPFDVKSIGLRIQIAERMIRETCQTHRRVGLGNDLSTNIDIKDPVKISGLMQHTDPFSLGNYLSQLARKKVDETSVFAARINAVQSLYEIFSNSDFLLIVSEVSNAISIAAEDNRLLSAYNGSGTFLCITTDDILGIWLTMEQRVDDNIKHSAILRSAGIDVGITVTMGRPFRPNASKTKRVRPTFERAIFQLDRRVKVSSRAYKSAHR